MKAPILLVVFSIFTVAMNFSYQPVLAQESITISTDKTSYGHGERYTISGKVSPVVKNQQILIQIQGPSHSSPGWLSFSPNPDGRYSYTLPVATKDIPPGNFTLVATYAGAKNQTTFSYSGPPCNTNPYQGFYGHGAPADNPRVVDTFGNAINGSVKVGQQIQITADLANGLSCIEPFAYLVQIQDQNGVTVSLSWITGSMIAGQSLNPAQSWTPTAPGNYTAQIFTWSSLDNPNALAPPLSTTINVV